MKNSSAGKTLSTKQTGQVIEQLQARFAQNPQRHKGLEWAKVQARLEISPDKIYALQRMEETGGEPDVVAYNKKSGENLFFDCSAESPSGRRSLCYDPEALKSRKENKPKNSAIGLALEMGVELLTEEQYRFLQTLGSFDTRTSSWIFTPTKLRNLGGALFCDRRYDTVFTYHNGAESYYAARGFRSSLKV